MAVTTLDAWMRKPASKLAKKRTSENMASTNHDQPQSKKAKSASKDDDSSTTPPPKSEDTSKSTSYSANTLGISEELGDIFSAPPNTLIIHACNSQGSWGAGIAKAFKDRYPAAYRIYETHCRNQNKAKTNMVGTAQLIPPSEQVWGKPVSTETPAKHFVGCLYTSRFYGARKDSPAKILAATGPAMEDLLRQVGEWNAKAGDAGERVGEVRICKINSGLFRVPWEETRVVLEGIGVQGYDVKVIKVVSPE